MPTKLYIIEREPQCPLETIACQLGVQPGDWIVDWESYPFAVWQVTPAETYVNLTTDLIAPVDYFQVADQWLRQFTAGSGLHEQLAVQGYGFWWTLGSPHFEPTRSAFGHNFAKIDILHAIKQVMVPEEIVVHGADPRFDTVLRQIFPTSVLSYTGKSPMPDPDNIKGSASMRIVRSLLSVMYSAYAMIRSPEICFFTPANSLQATNVGNKVILEDVYFAPLVKAMRDRGWRTAYIETLVPVTWKHLWARGWFFPSDLIEIIGHRRLLRHGLWPRLRSRWQTKWTEARDKLGSYLTYQGYDIAALLLPLIEDYFLFVAPSLDCMIALWRFVFKLWRPKLIYLNHYYGFVALSVIIAARSLGIVTVEQQHGIIAQHHRPYLPPMELGSQVRFPLCDYLIAWGQQTKRLLVEKQVYTPDKVRVCGFPRLDRLAAERPKRAATLDALDIPQNAKVVLYSSSSLVDGYIHPILNGIKEGPSDPDVYWIIKMHPGQQTRFLWEQAARELGLSRVRVIKGEFDFYALLAVCDLHISFASTTFVEAALWGKPNLGLALPHCPDFIGLVEAGAYYPVHIQELGKVVHTILHDVAMKESLLERQRVFAADWCLYDGQSVNHIVDELESIVRKS